MFRRPLSMVALSLFLLLFLGPASSFFAWAEGEEAVEEEGISLNRAVAAREIQNREPLNTEGPFTADGERLYIYLDVCNPTGEHQELTVTMHHLDRDRQVTQTVDVGPSRRWRTWVYHRMRSSQAGDWRVEVRAPDGSLLSEMSFQVVAEPS